MAYREVKMNKGDAQKIFGGLNDNFLPKGEKNKADKPNKNKTKTGSKKNKIH